MDKPETSQTPQTADCPAETCAAPPESVQEWLEMELRCIRYWCIAGPAGAGWMDDNRHEKPAMEERRDWLESVLGKGVECDPWKDRRIPEANN